MPVCKAEAHRALELLEDYYARLDEEEEKELKLAIERVIKIFKSRLFQALLDIQEFYELTLMDECKSSETKTHEAMQMASRWETSHKPFAVAASVAATDAAAAAAAASVAAAGGAPSPGARPLLPSKVKEELLVKLPELKSLEPGLGNDAAAAVASAGPPLASANANAGGRSPHGSSQLYAHDEIILDRGAYGLGFSIAGGIDNPHVPNDTSIYITKLIPGGAASVDQRLRVNDIILKVNDVSVVNVSHSVAVEALKRAGSRVVLSVKRKLGMALGGLGGPDGAAAAAAAAGHEGETLEVELSKGNKGLGFTIAGGIGNQHIPGDNGIYVTKVMDGGAAAHDGRIEVGDKLVSVKNYPGGDFVLDNCTHEEAVNALKKCKDKVVLVVCKAEVHYPSSPTIGQMHPLVGSDMGMGMGLGMSRRSISDEELRVLREVILHKSAAGLGFNIVGGEDGEGIFISFILAGGPADASKQVKRGDKILRVNNTELTHATHEDAAVALKNAGNVVSLKLLYCPDEYEKFEAKIHSIKSQVMSGSMLKMSEKKSLYIRTLFDYDPSKDEGVPTRGLAFSFGDIIHVVNASDDEWWQAKRMDPLGSEVSTGLIPSRNRWEKKMKSRERNVHWDGSNGRGTGGRRGGSLNRKMPFFKNDASDTNHDSGEQERASVDSKEFEGTIVSYELVQQIEIDYTRPVIVLGPLKDRINDELISEFPNKFGSCVPHTTRPKRQFEVDGRDYHFVNSREIMEQDIQNHKFIEAGQYNDNLYGTSIASVKEVAEKGKHCILDVSGNAIKRLQAARLFPIAIFIRPISPAFIKQVNDHRLSDEQCEKAHSRAIRLEQEFIQYFTAIVQGDTFEDVYERVKRLVSLHSTNKIWVPANEMF